MRKAAAIEDLSTETIRWHRMGGRMARLYERHAPGAVRFAFLLTGDAHVAQDLVQDAFLRVFRRFADLRKGEAFDAYLKRTIVNLSRDRLRRLKLEREHIAREASLPRASEKAPEVETGDALQQALQTLPPRQRAAIVLRHYEDLSEHQTAQVLNCSVGAVKSLTLRGMASLREQLGVRMHER